MVVVGETVNVVSDNVDMLAASSRVVVLSRGMLNDFNRQ